MSNSYKLYDLLDRLWHTVASILLCETFLCCSISRPCLNFHSKRCRLSRWFEPRPDTPSNPSECHSRCFLGVMLSVVVQIEGYKTSSYQIKSFDCGQRALAHGTDLTNISISLHLASHVKLESFIFPGLIGQLQPDMNLESPSVIFLCHYVSGLLICHICHLGIRNLFRKAPTCFLERTLCASWPGARQLMNLVWPRSSGSFTLCIPARSAIRYRWSYTSIVEHPWLCTSNDLHCGLYVIGHSALRSPSTNTVLAYSRQYVGKRHHV